MSYAFRPNDCISPMQSSYALARKAEQNYRDMINAKLLNTLERMAEPDYQSTPMPDHFHASVLQRVVARMEQSDVQD